MPPVTPPGRRQAMEFAGAVEKFSADLYADRGSADQGRTSTRLATRQINGNVEMAGSWNPTDGRWPCRQYDISDRRCRHASA